MTVRTLASLLAGVLALSPFAASSATPACTGAGTDRPRVGLVLGGGGARGIAHIGVIRRLEELRVPIDAVVGTSMGAVIGGLYATGMNSRDLESVVEGIDWKDIFADGARRAERPYRRKRDDDLSLFGPKFGVGPNSTLLPRGAISGQKIGLLLERATSRRSQVRDFDDLPIPFRAVAADVGTGDAVVLDGGNLAMAMRASMSIPGVFAPVEREGQLLVDGGIAKNLAVDVVTAMGVDVVIAVDVGTQLTPVYALRDFVAIANQLTNILVQRNTIEQRALLREQDVLIVPALGTQVTSAAFDAAAAVAISIGYEATLEAEAALARLAVDATEYAAHRAAIEACVALPPTPQFVRVDNQSRFKDSIIEERIQTDPGRPLDVTGIERDINHIYALGFLDSVRYEVVEEDGETGIVVNVRQDARGTQFIETGVNFVGDSDSSAIDVRIGFLKTDVDPLGSEFRGLIEVGENQGLLAELYKPLDEDLRYVVLPRLSARRRSLDLFDDDGNKLSTVQVEQYGGSIAFGRELGRHAAVFGGVRRFSGSTKVNVGSPASATDFEGGEYFASASWDRLDNRYVPSSGTAAFFEYLWSEPALGASESYEQLEASVLNARTVGRHTWLAGAIYGTTVSGEAPVQSLFTAGGPFRLSGLEPDQLSGAHFGVGLLGHRLRLFQGGFLPSYVGTTVEYGAAAAARHDIIDEGILNGSVYLAFDSPLGPLYAGYGFAEGGQRSYFLRIGTLVGTSVRSGY